MPKVIELDKALVHLGDRAVAHDHQPAVGIGVGIIKKKRPAPVMRAGTDERADPDQLALHMGAEDAFGDLAVLKSRVAAGGGEEEGRRQQTRPRRGTSFACPWLSGVAAERKIAFPLVAARAARIMAGLL